MNNERLCFYDIETFPNYFLIVWQFKNEPYDTFHVLENPTFFQLIEFLSNGLLVGFNNHRFDDVVISTMINKSQVEQLKMNEVIPPVWAYEFSQEIINKETDGYIAGLVQPTLDVLKLRNFETNSLNLKSFENMMNMSIIESSYDFNKPLSEKGKLDTLNYCKNDVLATRKAYEYLDSEEGHWNITAVATLRKFIADKLGVPEVDLIKKSTNSLLINLFESKLDKDGNKVFPTYNRNRFFEYIEQCDLKYALSVPEFKEWYEKVIKWVDDPEKLDKPTLTITIDNVIYDFGLGGGHGHHLQKMFENCFDSDFASLYPTLMINLVCFGEVYTKMFNEIVETRVKSKKVNEALASGLKLFINSCYGITRSEQNGASLYNPYLGLDVCIAGQCILFDMCLRIVALGGTVVQANTDGVIWKHDVPEIVRLHLEEFSKKINIGIDEEEIPYYYAKDVNNYFVLDDTGTIKKQKGVFTKKPYSNNYASPYMVMLNTAKKLKNEPLTTFSELFDKNPEYFIMRAKNTKNFEMWLGLEETFTRYGKRGQPLKVKGSHFMPLMCIGKQFRGYATKVGYNIRNYNLNTEKYVEIGALKTKKIPTLVSMDKPLKEDMNFTFYEEQTKDLEQAIGLI